MSEYIYKHYNMGKWNKWKWKMEMEMENGRGKWKGSGFFPVKHIHFIAPSLYMHSTCCYNSSKTNAAINNLQT